MNTLTLNLQFPERSDILFKVNMFPDGQRSITILEDQVSKLYKKVNILVVKSICSFADLELILSAASAISKHSYKFSLYSPYLLGARSDRKFEIGGDMYLDDVVIKCLKSANFDKIYCLDLHSSSEEIISTPLHNFTKESTLLEKVIFPDKGAEIRYNKEHLISCCFLKNRLSDGTITQVPSDPETFDYIINDNVIIIRDDLFDGGRSFIDLVKKIRSESKKSDPEIIITVTHFIGSNKEILDEMESLNVKIRTTNSYHSLNKYSNIEIIDVFENLQELI